MKKEIFKYPNKRKRTNIAFKIIPKFDEIPGGDTQVIFDGIDRFLDISRSGNIIYLIEQILK